MPHYLVQAAYAAGAAEEVPRAIGIAREFHRESRYRHIPLSEAKLLRVYGRLVTRSDTFGWWV